MMSSSPSFPPIYLLPTHLESERLHELEKQIPSLTYDPGEAGVIIGNISKPERALFELRRRGISFRPPAPRGPGDHAPGAKRRKTSDSRSQSNSETLKVARLAWFTDSLARGEVLPLDGYVILEVERDTEKGPAQSPQRVISIPAAAAAAQPATGRPTSRREADTRRPPLLQQTTSEETSVPPVPDFLSTPYSCQRPTPVDPPNASFVDELKRIRKTRILLGDAVGVRAYSTSIASVAAYPYPLRSQFGESGAPEATPTPSLLRPARRHRCCASTALRVPDNVPAEIARLPGCGRKIAELYQEWRATGRTREAGEIDADPRLAVLALFYDTWGVGDVTARDFYRKGERNPTAPAASAARLTRLVPAKAGETSTMWSSSAGKASRVCSR